MTLLNKAIPFLILLGLLSIYGLALAHPINLVTADIGRHIKNGEFMLNGHFEALKTNFYSYTYPNFPTLNHHWLSGVIFYIVWRFFGFAGVHIFFIALSLAAFFIFFRLAASRSNSGLAGLLSILIIPLLLERNEIRPEIFSYLFSGIFFWLLLKYRAGEISGQKLLVLPLLEILWVNLHIYFFLGLVIIGVFLLESLILKSGETTRGERSRTKKDLCFILFLTLVATLINPYGIHGALAPFSIFQNFGYHLAENQTVWFIEKILPSPNYLIFKIAFFVLILSFIIKLAKNKHSLNIPDLVLAIGFSVAGWLAIRNFAIFGLFALPITAGNLANGFKLKPETTNWLGRITLAMLGLIILLIVSGEIKTIYAKSQNIHLGLEDGNEKALEFFNKNNLTGPIFNNYDIGGYLIYGLPSEAKIFVDNRPEAYPADFFTKIYIPMQEDKKVWAEQNNVYKFNAIIFSYRDYTPWGQTFFKNILQDPEWSTVFADSRVIILLKKNSINQSIIDKYGKDIRIGHKVNQ